VIIFAVVLLKPVRVKQKVDVTIGLRQEST
jgi:hypothetical protein